MKTRVIAGRDLQDGSVLIGFMDRTATISQVRKTDRYVYFRNDTLGLNDRVGVDDEIHIVIDDTPLRMREYDATIRISANSPDEAAQEILMALGSDENAINDIGGVQVVPALGGDDDPCLACRGCGEAFDDLTAARDHGTSNLSGRSYWCGEDGFDLGPRSEVFG